MSELYAKGGEWRATLPEWTEAERKEMKANGGLCTQKKGPDLKDDVLLTSAGAIGGDTPPEVGETLAADVAEQAAARAADDISDMTGDERIAYLRKRGVQIETHEERVAAARGAVDAVSLRGDGEFVYMKIPADVTENVSRSVGPSVEGDALLIVLKSVFADSGVLDANTVKRETADRLEKMCGTQALKAPSLATMQKLGNQGGVEAYPLARGDKQNGFRNVSLYIDEIGALRQRPRNARAERLCAAAGLTGLSIHGDAYVGRLQIGPQGSRNVDFYESELERDSDWCKLAFRTHQEEYASINDTKRKSGTGEHYSWSQTDDEVEVVVTVPDVWRGGDIPLKLRVIVKYGKGDCLDVRADGRPLLCLNPLFDKIDVTGCSWTIEGKDQIIITMEKREEREWHTLALDQHAGTARS